MDPSSGLMLEVAYERSNTPGSRPRICPVCFAAAVMMGVITAEYQRFRRPTRYRSDAYSARPGIQRPTRRRWGIAYLLGCGVRPVGDRLPCFVVAGDDSIWPARACGSAEERPVPLARGVQPSSCGRRLRSRGQVGNAVPERPVLLLFDSRATDSSAGEGCGVVVLKRLTDAGARDGDRVRPSCAVPPVNQDGRSNGLTRAQPLLRHSRRHQRAPCAQRRRHRRLRNYIGGTPAPASGWVTRSNSNRGRSVRPRRRGHVPSGAVKSKLRPPGGRGRHPGFIKSRVAPCNGRTLPAQSQLRDNGIRRSDPSPDPG